MIDHLLFDRLKWVKDSDHVKNYVGLRLTKDVSIERYTFHSDGKIYKYQGDPESPSVDVDTLLTGDQVDREVVDGKEIYIRTYNTPKGTSLYKVSDILQNGGVSYSPLIRLYHAVSQLEGRLAWH